MYTGPKITTDGLIFALDAGSKRCYPGSGTAFTDIIDNSRGGTTYSDITYSSDKGGYFLAGNSSSGLNIPSSIATQLHGTPEASIEMYVRSKNLTSVADSGIIQLSAWNDSNGCLYFYNNGSTYFDTFRANRVSFTPSPSHIDPTKWHSFVITTINGTNGYKLYFNGVLYKQETGQATVSITGERGYMLGRNSTSRYLDGGIGVTRIYNKVLTPTEILNNFNSTIQRYK